MTTFNEISFLAITRLSDQVAECDLLCAGCWLRLIVRVDLAIAHALRLLKKADRLAPNGDRPRSASLILCGRGDVEFDQRRAGIHLAVEMRRPAAIRRAF
jgi:hypothetical protein